MKEPTKFIRITLEGGLIQYIGGVPKGYAVIVTDFDTDGAEESDLVTWKDGGEEHEACVSLWTRVRQGSQRECRKIVDAFIKWQAEPIPEGK